MINNIGLTLGYITIFLICFINHSWSQSSVCYTDVLHEQNYASNEEYRRDYDERMEARSELLDAVKLGARLDCESPIMIPVAVHYDNVGNQTLSCLTELALSQIDRLNQDFSSNNIDIFDYYNATEGTRLTVEQLAENGACIQFCLADKDHPSGMGLEDGDYAITINQGYTTPGGWNSQIPSVWAGYLNMKVIDDMPTNVLGYSPVFGDPNERGLVVSSCVWGTPEYGCGSGIGSGYSSNCSVNDNYELGRIATHEVGHYLGLQHPWGCNYIMNSSCCNFDDGIDDTPNTDAPWFGCPEKGSESCESDDMYMNYMDYTGDACAYMFTEQQSALMYARAGELWSEDCPKCSSTQKNHDARILGFDYPKYRVCGDVVSPRVILNNGGSEILTSVEIHYTLGNGPVNTYTWNGSLNQHESEVVTLPNATQPDGSFYILSVYTSMPNGFNDQNPSNDRQDRKVLSEFGAASPFVEDMEVFGAAFPTQGILIDNKDDDEYTWERKPGASAFGNGVYGLHMNNFLAFESTGNEDWFILPEIATSTYPSVELSYDLAYAYFLVSSTERIDMMKIMYSLDCSGEWQELWSGSGAELSTTAPMDSPFVPSINDWDSKMHFIDTYGADFVRIAFVNISGSGNNLYLDNINVTGSNTIVSNQEINSLSEFNISPNPSTGYLDLSIEFEKQNNYQIRIFDAVGKMVHQQGGSNIQLNERIDLSHLPNGIYFINLMVADQMITKKLILSQ